MGVIYYKEENMEYIMAVKKGLSGSLTGYVKWVDCENREGDVRINGCWT